MTHYNIASIPTMYAGVQFRSRLEARWACLFDFIEWRWEYEPIDIRGWTPDFLVRTCEDDYDILIEVKPYDHLRQFQSDDACKIPWLIYGEWAPAVGFFGRSPHTTHWHECGESSGGEASMMNGHGLNGRTEGLDSLWRTAGNIVQRNGSGFPALWAAQFAKEKFIYHNYHCARESNTLDAHETYNSRAMRWEASFGFDKNMEQQCISSIRIPAYGASQ